MTEVCSICKRLLDDPKDPTTENCGGDCLRCMAEFAEDPDCMTPYIRILKTENKYLRHEVGATKQELSDFRQEVSNAIVSEYLYAEYAPERLQAFTIPAPKPDPLVDVFCKGLWSEAGLSISTKEIRAALEARGLEIREKGNE